MNRFIIILFFTITCLQLSAFAAGLKMMVTKQNTVIQLKSYLTCGPQNSTCQKLCQNETGCEIPASQTCIDCYRDSDLTLRSLFNEPQKRYAVNDLVFDADTQARLFNDENVFLVGIRQNILLDPLHAESFAQVQAIWNQLCPAPRDAGDAVFLIQQTPNGYKPFALMCGENLHQLQYEASYGQGVPVQRTGDTLIHLGELK